MLGGSFLDASSFARLRAWKSAILGRNTGHKSGPHFAPAGDATTSSAATGTVPGTSMAGRMRWEAMAIRDGMRI